MATQYHLDSLPIEIIRRIASHCPFNSLLSFLLMNHEIRDACNEWIVFQAIVQNGPNRSWMIFQM